MVSPKSRLINQENYTYFIMGLIFLDLDIATNETVYDTTLGENKISGKLFHNVTNGLPHSALLLGAERHKYFN
ncbi:hypothetical protein DM15PD_07070 [Aristophania vespae]|nr:hypothetical protein DM15PD_07070 [Aristophania vespae]